MPILLNRRTRKRSDLSSLLEPEAVQEGSNSIPSTPANVSLEGVREDDEDSASFEPPPAELEDTFGSAALHLRRHRRTNGAATIGLVSSISSRTSFTSPSSRFTTMQMPRHSLSLPALHLTLQSALASKRYACSHLLALRFDDDDDDDGYWENVRSIMTLLSSALEDSTARLAEALEEAEKQRLQDGHPTSPSERSESPLSRDSSISPAKPPVALPFSDLRVLPAHSSFSFAPTPSSLARFAAHVDAMSSSLDDARKHLQDCIVAIREDRGSSETAFEKEAADVQHLAAMQAYEKLRRELGLALRECERGKNALSDVLEARRIAGHPIEEDEPEDELPVLSGSSAGSDDKHELTPLTPPNTTLPLHTRINGFDHAQFQTADLSSDFDQDDASMHLLFAATPHHLPPPGIEQVFESDPALGPAVTRERPKLTREERIRLMKARRESAKAGLHLASTSTLSDDSGSSRRPQSWGPTGEVVQELKDVIWKVGERRRKLAEIVATPDSNQLPNRTYPLTDSSGIPSNTTHSYDTSL